MRRERERSARDKRAGSQLPRLSTPPYPAETSSHTVGGDPVVSSTPRGRLRAGGRFHRLDQAEVADLRKPVAQCARDVKAHGTGAALKPPCGDCDAGPTKVEELCLSHRFSRQWRDCGPHDLWCGEYGQPVTKGKGLGNALAGTGGLPALSEFSYPDGSGCKAPAQAAVAIVTRAAWLQALFVVVFRTKRVPSSVAAADVFGVALEAARFSGDATVRRGGLVLLSSLVGVDSELWTKLPPASAAQARNALRAVAAADPEKELRELAAQLSSAVDEAIGEAPPVTTPGMPVAASPMIGALNIGL